MMHNGMGLLLRQCLSSEEDAFFLDLRPKYIVSNLTRDGLISDKEKDEILNETVPKSQVQCLMKILSQKENPDGFDIFVKVLEEENAYYWLADKLIEKKKSLGYNDNTDNLTYQLALGGVPSKVKYLFERKPLLSNIRNKLKEASGKRRWVVLHGMTGCGKSVLAAEAIRDISLFQKYFSAGICWITIGQLKNNNAIFGKMQFLWEKLKPNQNFPFTNLELSLSQSDEMIKTTRALRTEYLKLQNKNMLLILDDIWDKYVIEAFDIGCPVLATTNNKGVFDFVIDSCSYVPFENGLSDEESKEFLSNYVNTASSNLPVASINSIHNKCKGIPMLLSLIGGNMSQYGNKVERWEYWSNKLEEKGISAAFKRERNASGQLQQFHHTINLIIDGLPDEVKDYFLDFAIFDEDIYIPNKVLELLWNLHRFEVEDIMSDLHKRSLVYIEDDVKHNLFIYSIHDVYLKFLKEKITAPDLKKRHKKLIDAYLKLCRNDDQSFDFGKLPNDGYIYNYIGYHLHKADEVDLFPKIFLDLHFLQNKIRFSAPGDLLYDFETYKDSFLNDFEAKVDMIGFVRRNAHLICRLDSDIKQLALFEPSEKSVYKSAKELIRTKPSTERIYYEWCNQENVPYWSQLTLDVDFEDLNDATFSPDCSVVASAGINKNDENNAVMIWEISSGKVLDTLLGHNNTINCCTFNKEGSLLATASSDKTVRLWPINKSFLSSRRSSKTMSGIFLSPSSEDVNTNKTFNHNGEVLWCAFSSDDNFVVSCDNNGIVYVWESTSSNLMWKVEHNIKELPVNRCYFSPNGSYIATSSDLIIKVWNCSRRVYEKSFIHEKMVADFCFSLDSKFIYSASGSNIFKWNIMQSTSKEPLQSINNDSLIHTCCLSPHEQFIAAGTSLEKEHFIVIWNLSTRKVIANLKGHKNPIHILQFSNDSTKLLSASGDGCTIVWDMSDCNATSMVSLVNNLSVHLTDKLTIASSDQLNRIQVRTDTNGILEIKSEQDNSDITACSISLDCSEVIYGTSDGSIKTFRLKTEETILRGKHGSRITYLRHIGETVFISCSEDSTLRIWTSKRFISLKGHSRPVVMCVPYSNGDRILSCSEDGRLMVWDVNLAENIMKLEGHGNQKINFCDVSVDETLFCSASSDKTIKLWNACYGEVVKELHCDDCVRCCRFSPISPFLVYGEDSGSIKIWEYSSINNSPSDLGCVDGWVKDVIFSENGSQIIAVGDSIKLFKKFSFTYKLAQTFTLPGAFPCALWASSDFKILIFIHNSILYILKTVL